MALATPDLGDTVEDCAGCHADAVQTWKGSRHAVARTNGVFNASFSRMEHPWCLSCHAPTGGDGVDCASCHRSDEPEPCATCHEFPFQLHTPEAPFALGPNPAQQTVSEWRTSRAAAAGTTCVDCHMGERGHGFPGAHDQDLVRGLLQASAKVLSPTEASVTVTAKGAAHRVPTGDPFRRIEVRLATDPACEQVVGNGSLRRVISRTETSWALTADRTVPPDTPTSPATRTLVLEVSEPPAYWCLDYRYGDRRFEAELPATEVGYRIASGAVEPR